MQTLYTEGEPKNEYLIARVTRTEKRAVKSIAKQLGKSTGEFIRDAVRGLVAQLKKEGVA